MTHVKVRIDVRERALLENLDMSGYTNCELFKESLDIGDILIEVISDNVVTTSFIFERKTITDLAQSIKDKRYHDQKSRLLSSYRPDQIYYILEGNYHFQPSFTCSGLNNEVLSSCILGCQLRDKIGIFVTKNIADTVCLLESILKRLDKDPMRFNVDPHSHPLCDAHSVLSSYVVKSKKKENIDKRNLFLIQLAAIPGVSLKIADKIAAHLNIESMIQFYNLFKDMDKRDVLSQFREIPGIGAGLANLLYTHLF